MTDARLGWKTRRMKNELVRIKNLFKHLYVNWMNIEYLHAVISTFLLDYKGKNSAFKLTNATSFFVTN